jgi:hypothetical protein
MVYIVDRTTIKILIGVTLLVTRRFEAMPQRHCQIGSTTMEDRQWHDPTPCSATIKWAPALGLPLY